MVIITVIELIAFDSNQYENSSWANNCQQNLQLAKSGSTQQKPLFTIGENWKVTQCAKRVFNDYTFGWQEAPPHQNFEWWTHLNLLWQHLPPRVRLHFPKCFTRYSLSLLYLTLCCIVAHAQLALISEFRTIRFSNYYSSHLTRIFLSCPFKNESTYFECIIHTKIGNTEEGCFMKGWKWMLRNFWSKSLGIQWSIKVLLIDGSFVNLSIRQVYVRETMGTFLVPRSKCAGIKPSVRSPNCWAGSYKIMWKWVASTLLLSKVKNWG